MAARLGAQSQSPDVRVRKQRQSNGCFGFLKCLSNKKSRQEGSTDDRQSIRAPGFAAEINSGVRSNTIAYRNNFELVGQGLGVGAPSNSSAFDALALTNSQARQSSNNSNVNRSQRGNYGSQDVHNYGLAGSNPQIEQEIAEQERIMREIRIKNAKSIKDRNKVRINTNYLKDQVEFVEEYPLGESEDDRNLRKIYKYYCPICLRYFNHILISDCCNNYICRLCIGWQAKKAKKDENYNIKCSHCYKENFRLVDVDVNDKDIKYYTDTPFKCLQRSMQREQCGSTDKIEGHLEDLQTPRDFEGQVDQIHEFMQTPGNDEEIGQLIGVVGQFRINEDEMELRLPQIQEHVSEEREEEEQKMVVLPNIKRGVLSNDPNLSQLAGHSEKTIEYESLPQIVKVEQFGLNDQDRQDFVKAAHGAGETDRTIIALQIRNNILKNEQGQVKEGQRRPNPQIKSHSEKNHSQVQSPRQISQIKSSSECNNVIIMPENQNPPHTAKIHKAKFMKKYEKIIQNNNYLRSGAKNDAAHIERIYGCSSSKKVSAVHYGQRNNSLPKSNSLKKVVPQSVIDQQRTPVNKFNIENSDRSLRRRDAIEEEEKIPFQDISNKMNVIHNISSEQYERVNSLQQGNKVLYAKQSSIQFSGNSSRQDKENENQIIERKHTLETPRVKKSDKILRISKNNIILNNADF